MSINKNAERNSALLYIGKRIMEDVLNKTNEGYIQEVANPSSDIVRRKLENLSEEQVGVLQELIPWITYGMVMNILWLFEQNEDIQLLVEYEGKKINIAEISYGLEEELNRWVEHFGKYKTYTSIEFEKQFKLRFSDWLNRVKD